MGFGEGADMVHSILTIEDDGDFAPWVSPEKPRSSISLLFSPILFNYLAWNSYSPLPEEPLKLSVRKLNGSSFDIKVSKTATVAELKQAVEAAFRHIQQKGQGKISWRHLWGHFCLCYDGQKLVADTDYIRNFGIKDGDQLYFIRYVSTGYSLVRKHSKKRAALSKQHKRSVSQPNPCRQNEEDLKGYDDDGDIETGNLQRNRGSSCIKRSKSCPFTRDWFSHCKLANVGKMSIKRWTHPSKIAAGLLGSCRKILRCCSGKHRRHTGNPRSRSILSI